MTVDQSRSESFELRYSDAVACADYVRFKAVWALLARTRPTETIIREWMIDNVQGTSTTRQEFEETVRRILTGE